MWAGPIPLVLRSVTATLVVLFLLSASAWAQQRDVEAAVKATFVIRFASFVTWPAASFPEAAHPVVICIAGDASFARLVETAAQGERIGERGIAVRRFNTLPQNPGCHILYAAGDPGQNIDQMLQIARGQAVLTVTDDLHGRTHGMVHFVREGGRVRFVIDRNATDAAGLNVSSRLLAVALSVRSRRAS
jgi:hypothetical protein